MRHLPFAVVGFVLCTALGVPGIAAAQPLTLPTIHRVTLQPDTGVLTIAGTGLGPDLFVSVDGQPVSVLPGASDSQVEVMAPATVLTMPGTYRLTVVDPARRIGDAFVVASPAAPVAVGSAALTGTPAAAAASKTILARPTGAGSVVPATRRSVNGPAPLVIEDSGSPFRTAIGYLALSSNTTGDFNTAIGYQALRSNTSGHSNTASGFTALSSNTMGNYNTAAGTFALLSNTIGLRNTASGYGALSFNNTGNDNTASGYQALYSNTTGGTNTATGSLALYANTSGSDNTAIGAAALSQSTGVANTALGYDAGSAATTGSFNVFLGASVRGTAADTNTIRIGLPYNSSAGQGQNRTFIAGIHGTQVTGSYLPVVVSASGQLGTLIPAVLTGGPAALVTPAAVEQQLQVQRAINAAQQATIEDLVARLARLEAQGTGRVARRE